MNAMKTAVATEPVDFAAPSGNTIQFPLGLLGFEGVKQFGLLADPAEDPFLWLEMLDDSNRGFLIVPPSAVLPDYQPDLSPDDVAFLELDDPSDALLFNIVTLRPRQAATVNLKGPLVVNRHTLVGKQVIPLNVASYPVQFPLP